MKNVAVRLFVIAVMMAVALPVSADFSWLRALGAAVKTAQAVTLTDAQMAEYVKESVDYMDRNNKVSGPNSKYTQRLKRLTQGIKDADGIPLNFKVYEVQDVNAFACPDGSVRVFSALMDMMTDDELMGIIGHEIGHVRCRHSKNAFKNQLLTGALRDAVAATGGRAGALADSQLADLGETLLSARYSQKQENEADDSGYDFLVANGRNPWGMVKAFEKFQGMEGGKSSYIQKMFSSHPQTSERIKRISARASRDGYRRP